MVNQYSVIPIEEFSTASDRVNFTTHIWRYKHKKFTHLLKVFDELNQKHLDFSLSDLLFIHIFPASNDETLNAYKTQQLYDNYLNEYFKEVLASGQDENIKDLSINTFSYAILPKKKLLEIEDLIKSYGFEKHLCFFIHLICRIQSIYHKDIANYAKPINIKSRKKLPKELDDLVNVIKGQNVIDLSDRPLSKFTKQIKFIGDYGTRTIKDNGLISGIINGTRNYWSYGNKKNWEKNMRQIAFDEEQSVKVDYFNQRLAYVLYQFVTKTKLFSLGKDTLSIRPALFVWQIMYVSGIKTIGRDGKAHDIKINRNEIKSLIFGYVRRHKVEKKPIVYNIKPNLKDLKKYFDKQFIGLGSLKIKNAEYNMAQSISSKYGITELTDEIAIILNCLECYRKLMNSQDYKSLNSKRDGELNSFIKLLKTSETGIEQLDHISLKFSNDEKEHKISNKSLMLILLDALNVHKYFNPEEFGADIWKTDIKMKSKNDSSFSIIEGKRMSLPSERFLAKFASSFAAYLKSKGIMERSQMEESQNSFYIINSCLTVQGYILPSNSSIFFKKIKRWIALSMGT